MFQQFRKVYLSPILVLTLVSGLALPAASEAAAEAAAKIQFVVGDVTATSSDGKKRRLGKGDRLYAGDTVQSGDNGAAQIIYRDRSRMAVRVNTTFKIETYEFDNKNESIGSSVFSLLSGALRAVTGLIGQANKENVTINTPLATIGIRGTDHEVVHIVQQAGRSIAKAGTYNKVYLGGTELRSRTGKIEIDLRQTGFIGGTPGNIAKPVKIPDLPQAIKTQIIEKVPMQAKRVPQPTKDQATSRTAKTQQGTRSLTGTGTTAIRSLTNTTTTKTDSTTTKALEPTISTTTLKTLEPSLSTDTQLKTLEPSLSTDTTLRTLEPSLTTDTTLKTLEPTLSEPVLKEPVLTTEPLIKEPILTTEPILKEPVLTTEPILKEPVLTTEPILKDPILTQPLQLK